MKSLQDIKTTISEHFGNKVVPIKELSSSNGSKTVRLARCAALLIAHEQGHNDNSIAKEFGFKSEKSASNAYYNAKKQLSDPNSGLHENLVQIREKLQL